MSRPSAPARAPTSLLLPASTPVGHWSALPAALLALVCQHLTLRQLLAWSTVDRAVRSVVCPDLRQCSASAVGAAGECWRCVPTVQLQWLSTVVRLNGVALQCLSARINTELISATNEQRQPTIAEAFAGVSLTAPLHDSHIDRLPPTPPLPSPPHVPFPLIPSLAAMLRSLRFVRRLEYSGTQLEPANIRVLLTVLTALPSFPLLHCLALKCYDMRQQQQRPQSDEEMSGLVNGVYGCLHSLPHLTSLQIVGDLPIARRDPNRAMCVEQQFAWDVLSALLGERLLHASLPKLLLVGWENKQAQTAEARHSRQRLGQQVGPATRLEAPADNSAHWPQYTSIRSLTVTDGVVSIRRLVQLFPSLALLDAPGGCSRGEAQKPPWPVTARHADERDGRHDSSSSSGGCALRFLSISAYVSGLPEVYVVAKFDCLHFLRLRVAVQSSGPGPLAPLAALASLTQLRELTLEVGGGDVQFGLYKIQAHEVFDLTWLDQLAHLRYLHIHAPYHTSPATLHSLGLLPSLPPPPDHRSLQHAAYYPPSPPCFVSRVEQLGLALNAGSVGFERAGEFVFDAWTRLQRCALYYVTQPMVGGAMWRQDECEAGNGILRERVGADRWFSEEVLVSGRWDSRWKREMASRL